MKSYIYEDDDYIVYANPFNKGIIKFNIYKNPLPKNLNRIRKRDPLKVIEIKDQWKNNYMINF